MNKEKVINELLELDCAFSEDTKKFGAPGYIKYFSEEAVMTCDRHNPNVVGKEKINDIISASINEYGLEASTELLNVITKQLNWGIVSIIHDECDMLIVTTDKNEDTPDINKAKELGVKIMTLKQIKLLFL